MDVRYEVRQLHDADTRYLWAFARNIPSYEIMNHKERLVLNQLETVFHEFSDFRKNLKYEGLHGCRHYANSLIIESRRQYYAERISNFRTRPKKAGGCQWTSSHQLTKCCLEIRRQIAQGGNVDLFSRKIKSNERYRHQQANWNQWKSVPVWQAAQWPDAESICTSNNRRSVQVDWIHPSYIFAYELPANICFKKMPTCFLHL